MEKERLQNGGEETAARHCRVDEGRLGVIPNSKPGSLLTTIDCFDCSYENLLLSVITKK